MINEDLHIRPKWIKTLLSSLLLALLSFQSAKTQTVQFSMEVQPELSIEVLQSLNFGTIISNSGTQQINLGDRQMGIFEIKALSAQSALLTIEHPEYLTSSIPNNNQQIPIEVSAAYSAKPYEYNTTRSFSGNNLWVSLSSENQTSSAPTWENGYVYIYGLINVGEVPVGPYSGTLVLNVVYQ